MFFFPLGEEKRVTPDRVSKTVAAFDSLFVFFFVVVKHPYGVFDANRMKIDLGHFIAKSLVSLRRR